MSLFRTICGEVKWFIHFTPPFKLGPGSQKMEALSLKVRIKKAGSP